MERKIFVAHMEEMINMCRILIRKLGGKRQFSRSGYR
jgi:hypothetical protein